MNSSDVDGELERLRIRMLEQPSVVDAEIREGKLRVYLEDESYMNVWISRRLKEGTRFNGRGGTWTGPSTGGTTRPTRLIGG